MGKPTSAVLLGLALVLAGCAGASAGAGSASRATPSRTNSSVITQKQLEQYPNASAYDIVERLHPQWLISRTRPDMPGAAATPIQVYLGDSRVGGVDEQYHYRGGVDVLRNFTGAQLASIQYLDRAQAIRRFGQANPNGAIVLTQR